MSQGNALKILSKIEVLEIRQSTTDKYLDIRGWIFDSKLETFEVKISVGGGPWREAIIVDRLDVFQAFEYGPHIIRSGFRCIYPFTEETSESDSLNIKYQFVTPCGLLAEGEFAPKNIIKTHESKVDSYDRESFSERCTSEMNKFFFQNNVLQLSSASVPEVSIVIVTYNKAELIYKCLSAIRDTVKIPYEVIIIDNNSHPSTQEILKRVRGATVVFNKENIHYIKAVNQGAKMAKGKGLLLLNPDCFVLNGAVENAFYLLKNRDVGVVGGRLYRTDGAVYEEGCFVYSNGATHFNKFGEKILCEKFNNITEVDYVSGAFLMTSKELFHLLGGFDEKYNMAYYEDVDYCFKIKNLGRKVLCHTLVRAIHVGNASFHLNSQLEALWFQNWNRFFNTYKGALKERIKPEKKGFNLIDIKEKDFFIGYLESKSIMWAEGNNFYHPFHTNLINFDSKYLERFLKSGGYDCFKYRYNIGFIDFKPRQLTEEELRLSQFFEEFWTFCEETAITMHHYLKKPVKMISFEKNYINNSLEFIEDNNLI